MLFLLATLLNPTILVGSIHFATICIAFWDSASNNAFPYLVAHCAEFAKFPTTLYGRFLQIGVTWVLPFVFVSYYPGTVLLSKPDASLWPGYAAPLVGPAVALVASFVWRRGLVRDGPATGSLHLGYRAFAFSTPARR